MIDFIGELRRIMNMNAGETFNPATDSLEAIANALGIGPSVGLSMFGICDPAMAASPTIIVTNNLGGLVDDIFNDEFYMQVILNANLPGTAPEGEIRRITNFVAATQTFTTDAFSANVEANDLVLILHETLISIEITGRGTFTLSDLVLPEDNLRTEGGNYFRGCMLMPIEGAARFQPRLIVSYTGAGGIFALDPGNPFSVLPGLVDYIIIRNQTQFVPLADGTENRLPADVTGNKTDTAAYAKTATASALRYMKGLLDAGIAVSGLVNDGAPAVADFETNLTEATNDHYNGMLLMFITGPNAGQAHTIDDYIGATKNVWFHANDWWTDVPVNGNVFVILPSPALRIMTGLITWDIFHENNDAAVNVNANNAGLTDIFHHALVVNHHYLVRSLRLKCADPIAETVTVSLFELVNDALIVVDTFAITNANFANYFSLMDMFGLSHLAGDELRVTVASTGAANVAVIGQYSLSTTG